MLGAKGGVKNDGNDFGKSADGALCAAGHGSDSGGGLSAGFDLPGISGIALVGVGTIMAAMHFGTLTAVALLLVIIAVLAVLVSWLLRSAAKGDVAKSKLFLHQKEELREQQDMQVLVGHEGRTLSVLRPSGIGDFDGVRLNVVTEGEFIENGVAIRIARVEGGKIVVKAIQS